MTLSRYASIVASRPAGVQPASSASPHTPMDRLMAHSHFASGPARSIHLSRWPVEAGATHALRIAPCPFAAEAAWASKAQAT